MRFPIKSFVVAAALGSPWFGEAQHSHGGGGGMDLPRREKHVHAPPPALPRGILPPGSPREIEVLVVSYGFSPNEIPATQGEEVVLSVRRSDESRCKHGFAIPAKQILVQLPMDETVPITLKLDRAETIGVTCTNEDVQASIIVAPR